MSAARPAAWLAAITLLASALRFWAFGSIPSDPFYDAAVRSMGLSWRNLFFGAFDPAGTLAIDKPPVDLWLQVLATKLLGFSSASVRLPEAIAGTVAVPLLYDLLRREYGPVAGLSGSAALAVCPVAVLTSRSDTMDTLCGAVLLASAWSMVALRPARGVLIGAALAGLAFEIKLFQATIAFPALAALAWQRADRATLRGAGLMLVGVAAAWPLVASLVPGAHPWPLGSSNGQLWNVILVYNGVWRLGSASGPRPPIGPSPWRLFTPGYMELVGYQLLVTFGAALSLVWRGWRPRRPLTLAVAVWIACGFVVFSAQGWVRYRYFEAFTPAVAAGLGIALAALTPSRPALTALAVSAALAWPLASSIGIVRSGRFDSQTLGARPTAWVDNLRPYSISGKLAVSSAVLAGPLIVRDGAPVTILTSWKGRPFVSAAQLQAKVARGQVRYALLDPGWQAPAVQWALAHGRDLTVEVGVGAGLRLVELAP